MNEAVWPAMRRLMMATTLVTVLSSVAQVAVAGTASGRGARRPDPARNLRFAR